MSLSVSSLSTVMLFVAAAAAVVLHQFQNIPEWTFPCNSHEVFSTCKVEKLTKDVLFEESKH